MKTPLVELFRWAERHENARLLPDHLLLPAEREAAAAAFVPTCKIHLSLATEARDKALDDLGLYANRRRLELLTADYLSRSHIYPDLVRKMRGCRRTGQIGLKEQIDGSVNRVVAWDQKCNLNRLCPDEAREEQMRLSEKYVPAIREWLQAKRGRQIQFAVLTWPNVKPGRLHDAKREMAKQVAAWLKRKLCAAVKGALVTQEDPLGSSGDWNLHVNVILLVEGRFDWSRVRQDWYAFTRRCGTHDFIFIEKVYGKNEAGKRVVVKEIRTAGPLFDAGEKSFSCYFRDVTKGDVLKTVMELVKYSAKHITAKQDQKQGCNHPGSHGIGAPGGTEAHHPGEIKPNEREGAPGLVAWPPDRFCEWWEAGKGFRRTRSYGELFRLPAVDRPGGYESVEWVGRIVFDEVSGEYKARPINLIPAHKSGDQHVDADNVCLKNGHDPPTQHQSDKLLF